MWFVAGRCIGTAEGIFLGQQLAERGGKRIKKELLALIFADFPYAFYRKVLQIQR